MIYIYDIYIHTYIYILYIYRYISPPLSLHLAHVPVLILPGTTGSHLTLLSFRSPTFWDPLGLKSEMHQVSRLWVTPVTLKNDILIIQ